MLFLQDITYAHPNRDVLFDNLHLTINKQEKIALIGRNGAGKSTLLKILAGKIPVSDGIVNTDSLPYYIPQLVGHLNQQSIASVLGVAEKLSALREILAGEITEANMAALADDWTIEERCQEAFNHWELPDLDLTQKMETLSGGQKTKVFLAGIAIHNPEIVLMDEPSNHLDGHGRTILYDYIRSANVTLIVVSHDKTLLNLVDSVFELTTNGVTVYGGNYDFYKKQKQIENNALDQDIKSKEKALRKAKEVERESMQRQQKLDSRGKKKQEKAGLPTISMNTFKNNAEKSTSRMKDIHAEKVGGITSALHQLREELPDPGKMKVDFNHSKLHRGKILVTATMINFSYDGRMLWKKPLSFQITSGQRIAVKGRNGSGKTTLIKLIMGELAPDSGTLDRSDFKAVYIDQDYSFIDDSLTVYGQAQKVNSGELQEHEIKIRLNRFLFTKDFWDKPCSALSGGEKMRLMLCSLAIANQAPDMIVLDEPTNNLDIQSSEILTSSINGYEGTLLVISHDQHFLHEIRATDFIALE